MARPKRRRNDDDDPEYKVQSYLCKQCERRNVVQDHGGRMKRARRRAATYQLSRCVTPKEQNTSHTASECTISLNTVDENNSHVEGDEYVDQVQRGWIGTEHTSFSTTTRASEVQWYEQLGEKCEEWEELCRRTFTDMIRCCICGVCELGSVRTSTFEFMEADPQYMIDDDVPSRVRNPGLPGDYVVETHGDKQMWKVCKECKKNPAAGFEYCVDYDLEENEYMKWLMASDIDERQVLQCVDVGYQISKKHATDSGYTGQAHGFAMFMAPIIRPKGSIYERKDNTEPLHGCDGVLYNSMVKHGFKESSQRLLFHNMTNNQVYQHLRCMAEVPDFSRNTFLSHDVVKDILEIARNRDPAITRVDNKFASDLPGISGTPSSLDKRQKVDHPVGHQGIVKVESNTHAKEEPQSDCDEKDTLMPRDVNDNDHDDDASGQNMVVLPVDPPFKNVLTNDTLLSVGHVYPRQKGNEREVLLSKPQGESSFFMNGKALTLEATLFPYLFPESTGYFDPTQSSKKKTHLADFQNYMKRRMSMLFSPFTMVQEYILMMYQILRVMLCSTSGQKYMLKKAYDKRIKKYPNESEHDRIQNLVTYVMPKSVWYSPSWWRHKLNDLTAITKEMGLPHYFLTLTVDNSSEMRWDEYNAMQSILNDMNANFLGAQPKKKPHLEIANAQAEAAMLFHHRVVNFMDMFILGGHRSLGGITHNVIRYEMQGRQALHAHILLWSTADDVRVHEQEITRDILMELDANGNWIPPDPTKNPVKHKIHCMLRRKNCHVCRPHVCGKKRPCKLGFPYEIYTGGTKYDEERKEFVYNCPNYHSRNVVSYHPELMLAWGAHICLKRVTHADFTYYLLKYTMKAEPTGQLTLNKEIESQMNMSNVDAAVVKVVNAMTQSQPVSEVEAALQMMRIPIVTMNVIYDGKVDKCPVNFLMSTPPDLRKVNVGMARGTINSVMDYYENRPDNTDIDNMTFTEYHRQCYFPVKKMTSDRKKELYVGPDKKQRHVYYRDHPKIVRVSNYWPSKDPENFFYVLILCKIPFRLEGTLRNNSSQTYYEHCQDAGLIESLDDVKEGSRSKLEHVLQEYYTDHFTKNYCIDSTVDEIIEYYDTMKFRSDLKEKIDASLVNEFNPEHLAISDLPPLNQDQEHIFSQLKQENFVGLHVVRGAAGTGKSVLIHHIVHHCTVHLRKHVLVTAISGTAAARLPGGKTLHSALGMGQGTKTSIMHTVFKPGTTQYAECRKSSVLIIDEAFMLSSDFLLTCVSKYASSDSVSYVEDIFSLKGIILVGDDNQLPPVCRHRQSDSSKNSLAMKPPCSRCLTRNCILFKYARQYELSVSERQRGDDDFRHFLSKIPNAIPTQDEIDKVLGQYVLRPDCDETSPEFTKQCDELWIKFLGREGAMSLHAHRETTAMFNNRWLNTYLADETKVHVEPMTNYDEIYGIDPVAAQEMRSWYFDNKFHELTTIAVGCPVVSLVNKRYKNMYLSNGTICTVHAIHFEQCNQESSETKTLQNVKRIDVLMPNCAQPIPVYRTVNTSIHNGHTCKRKNFPLLLAKSMTIHKCQGSSLTGPVLLDFRNLFEVGMGYVLLTRKTSRENLALTCCPTPEDLQVLSTYVPGTISRNSQGPPRSKAKARKTSKIINQLYFTDNMDRHSPSASPLPPPPDPAIITLFDIVAQPPTVLVGESNDGNSISETKDHQHQTHTYNIPTKDWMTQYTIPNSYAKTKDFFRQKNVFLGASSLQELIQRRACMEQHPHEWFRTDELDFYAQYIYWKTIHHTEWSHVLDTVNYQLIFRSPEEQRHLHISMSWKHIKQTVNYIFIFLVHDNHFSLVVIGGIGKHHDQPFAFYLDSWMTHLDARLKHSLDNNTLLQFINSCPWRTDPVSSLHVQCLPVPQQKDDDGNCAPYTLLFYQRIMHVLSMDDSPPSEASLRAEILSWSSQNSASQNQYSTHASILRAQFCALLEHYAMLTTTA